MVKRTAKDSRPSVEELAALVAFMRAQGVSSLRVGDVEIALSVTAACTPPAAAAVPDAVPVPAEMPKSSPFPDDGVGLCACGHHPAIEHTPEGLCLHGCSAALCASTIGATPEEG